MLTPLALPGGCQCSLLCTGNKQSAWVFLFTDLDLHFPGPNGLFNLLDALPRDLGLFILSRYHTGECAFFYLTDKGPGCLLVTKSAGAREAQGVVGVAQIAQVTGVPHTDPLAGQLTVAVLGQGQNGWPGLTVPFHRDLLVPGDARCSRLYSDLQCEQSHQGQDPYFLEMTGSLLLHH